MNIGKALERHWFCGSKSFFLFYFVCGHNWWCFDHRQTSSDKLKIGHIVLNIKRSNSQIPSTASGVIPTCRARLAGSWLHQSDPPPRWGNHWVASGRLVRRSVRPSAGPGWSSGGSSPKRSACGTESGGSLSLGRSSGGQTEGFIVLVSCPSWGSASLTEQIRLCYGLRFHSCNPKHIFTLQVYFLSMD